ncbi:von Willebrand factor type A domain-containing protein [Lentinula raphanica]|uniref:von Willebrand factor type A domain-containing protein n=1 Tax=Lentinula raphanica TaxID=153919 RepID=A0AA38P5S4_9AGAR|nr:von Willebrand factor type A domain-containing protein [Lentinula raphanica]KAJ3974826.1 von Willebrand factor type A domain-containing protein [Lentinula raphanica]
MAPPVTNPYCRLYDSNSGTDLLLDGCCAQVTIIDVHAVVTTSQRFTHHQSSYATKSNPVSGVYTFSLMKDAAVCEFEMVRGNGTKVSGLVKEKQAAKREYDQAISQGYTASLGQQETGDVFSISVGNIQPAETVTINLRYIQPLTDDEKKDQIKFIFPRTYAQRYGTAPTTNSFRYSTVHQPFQMNVAIQQAGVIKSISCPSRHPITLECNDHTANVTLSDRSGFLTQDVVLVVTAAGLDAPRCFVEPHPSPNYETTAFALTFVPRFNVPDVQGGMEYIFLVDRSGSMQGTSMSLVRHALVILLRGLPTNGTTFNIFSFGTNATKLWASSRTYDQSSLEDATRHVDHMHSDYGGTEIASALQLVYDSLPKPLARPVAVFLLTDGEAWDVSTCVKHTSTARTTLPDSKTFLRVFAVGIGDGASSDTCESIARAGGGMTVYVKEGESLTGKCSRLVRAARTPEVKVNIVWGFEETKGEGKPQSSVEDDDDFQIVDKPSTAGATSLRVIPSTSSITTTSRTISLFDSGSDSEASHPTGPPPKVEPVLPAPPQIQQSPLPGQIPSLFPGTRTEIYAIVRTPKAGHASTTEVKVQGVVTTTGDLVELVVPVSTVLALPSTLNSRANQFAFLHTFAAKALIKDLEAGKHAFPPSVSQLFEPVDTPGLSIDQHELSRLKTLKESYIEKEIVRLGTEYQLASRYTSFVAVDRSDKSTTARIVGRAADLHERKEQERLNQSATPSWHSYAHFPSRAHYSSRMRVSTSDLSMFSCRASSPEDNSRATTYSVTVVPPLNKVQGLPYDPLTEAESIPSRASREIRRDSLTGAGQAYDPAHLTHSGFYASHSSNAVPPPPPPPPVVPDSVDDRYRQRRSSRRAPSPAASAAPVPAASSLPLTSAARYSVSLDGRSESDAQSLNASRQQMGPKITSIPSRNDSTSQNSSTFDALLAAVARLQQWHGGFKLDREFLVFFSKALRLKLSSRDPDAFASRLKSEARIDDRDVGATLIALIWMERNKHAGNANVTDDETLDMRTKAENWVKGQVKADQNKIAELKKGVSRMLGLKG